MTRKEKIVILLAVMVVLARVVHFGWTFHSSGSDRAVRPPTGGIDPEQVEVSEITILPHPWGDQNCFVVAKITNRAPQPLVLPVFNVTLLHAPEEVQKVASSFIIAPGETCFFKSGGFPSPPGGQESSFARVTLSYSNPFMDRSYVDRQLKFRPLLGLTEDGRFQNDSGLEIAEIRGKVVIADAVGSPLSVIAFTFEPNKVYPASYRIGGDYRGSSSPGRRIIQIESFREAGTTIPDSVPVAPSLR